MACEMITYPLDNLKTRAQMSSQKIHFQQFLKLNYKQSYQGFTAALLKRFLKTNTKFIIHFQIRDMFTADVEKVGIYRKILSRGFFSVIGASIFANYFDVIKIRMIEQNIENKKGFIESCKHNIRDVFRGLHTTILRNSLISIIEIGTFDVCRKYFIKRQNLIEGNNYKKNKKHNNNNINLVSGTVAALASSVLVCPFDNIRTKVMSVEYANKTSMEILSNLLKNKGIKGLLQEEYLQKSLISMLPKLGSFSQRENNRFSEKQNQMNEINQLSGKKRERSASKDILNDRFIPNKIDSSFFSMLVKEEHERSQQKQRASNKMEEDLQISNSLSEPSNPLQDLNETLREQRQLNRYTSLLKQNILLNNNISNSSSKSHNQENIFMNNDNENFENLKNEEHVQSRKEENIFKYKRNSKRSAEIILDCSPLKMNQTYNLKDAQGQIRKIQKTPYKILDAPRLRDDFYYNLLDWSIKNIITIGLDNAIYTWSAKTNDSYKLLELEDSVVTSLSWNQRGILLATGDDKGQIRIYDSEKKQKIREIDNHSYRVGSLCWNNNLITSGSRDSKIFITDIRSPRPYVCKFIGHKQEVCGTKWCCDGQTLASGGNDNKVFIWSLKMQNEITRFVDHVAAVKALDWSPHHYNILATGGGTTDKTLKYWNINTLQLVHSIDTGSQICNMRFSKNSNEIVTTHGFSQNQIAVWQCQNYKKIATLYGHTYRVLYLAASPDGESIVTGSGDETLRFWRTFQPGKNNNGEEIQQSKLDPFSTEIR